MKKVHKWQLYVFLFSLCILVTFLYGVIIGGIPNIYFILVVLGIEFVLTFVIEKIKSDNVIFREKIYHSVVFVLITLFICGFFYTTVNEMVCTPIREYETTALQIEFGGRGTNYNYVYFENPEQIQKKAKDYLFFIMENDECIEVNDRIKVTESKGFFNVPVNLIKKIK